MTLHFRVQQTGDISVGQDSKDNVLDIHDKSLPSSRYRGDRAIKAKSNTDRL